MDGVAHLSATSGSKTSSVPPPMRARDPSVISSDKFSFVITTNQSPVDSLDFLLGLPLLPSASEVEAQRQTLLSMMEGLMAAGILPTKYHPILQASTLAAATNSPLSDPLPSAAVQADLLSLISPHEDMPPPPLSLPTA
eukprot:15344807-Ditylum_brightwellii.AAC.1